MEEKKDLYEEVGKRIKLAREIYQKKIGVDSFTQTDLARLIDASPRSIAAWEQGMNLPGGEYLVNIWEKMQISVDWLLFGGILRVPGLNVPDWVKRMMLIMREYPPAAEGMLLHHIQFALREIEENFPDAARRVYSQNTVRKEVPAGGESVVSVTIAERESPVGAKAG